MTWRKTRNKGEWTTPEGYKVTGNNRDGFEAFDPRGQMVVFWASSRSVAQTTCDEHLEKETAR